MDSSPEYAIIVPAYNEAKQLPTTLPAMLDAIAGVRESSGRAGELIVVNNNSSDATGEVAERLGAKVVFEPVNMIGKARNAGAAVARGPLLVFIDADTTPSAELLGAALDALNAQDSHGCCGGGAVVALDPAPSWLVRRLAGVWNVVSRLMGYPAGCFFFCRKDAFDEVGGFSEALYASEEIWLARALKKWGRGRNMRLRILTVPIVTSSRKMDHPPRMFGMLLLMFVFPFAVKFKGLCGYWYKRDDAASATPP